MKKYLRNGLISHIYTLTVVLISFVIFSVEEVSQIGLFIKNMFGLGNLKFINFETIYYLKNYIVIFIIAGIASTPLIKKITDKMSENKKMKTILGVFETIGYMCLLIICTSFLISDSFNPFIYFRF